MSFHILRLIQNYPSLILLIGALCTILPPMYSPHLPWPCWGVLPLIYLLLLACYVKKQTWITAGIVIILSGGVVYSQSQFSNEHYLTQFNRASRYLNGEIMMTDPALIPSEKWLEKPNIIQAQIKRINGKNAEGKIMIRLPSNSDLSLQYGDIFDFQGTISIPHPPLGNSDFDFSTYLFSRGSPAMLYADTMQFISHEKSFMTGLLEIRNYSLNRFTSGLSNDIKNKVAAIFFGCRQGIEKESKNRYISSGTIHIFVVSGLHMGILALILYGLCFCIPQQWRGWVVISLLFLFLMTTGFQPSAFRAWVMCSVILIFATTMRQTLTLNALFLAALILLCANPYSWFDMGFRYSFVITFFLILGWKSIQAMCHLTTEHISWIPLKNQRHSDIFQLTLAHRLLKPFLSCIIALLAAIPLASMSMGMFVPLSIFLNLLVMPLVGIIMLTGIFKLLLGNTLDAITTAFEYLIRILDQLCGAFGNSIQNFALLGHFGGFEIVIIWGGLLIVCCYPRRWTICSFFSVIFAFYLGGYLFFSTQERPQCTLIYGGDIYIPTYIIRDAQKSQTYLVNMGSAQLANFIPNYLRQHGIDNLEEIIITHPSANYYRGIHYLLAQFEVKKITILGQPNSRTKLNEHLASYIEKGGRVEILTPSSLNLYQRDFFTFSGNKHQSLFQIRDWEFSILQKADNIIEYSIHGNDSSYLPYQSLPKIEFLN